jgi:hypothetical protein
MGWSVKSGLYVRAGSMGWAVNVWAEFHIGWHGFLRNRIRLKNVIYEFSFYLRVVCFTGIFEPLTKSKNYEI